ncbi:Outer membrane protein TolC [Marivirga sericea]|uniref:Outer membrane protein TolC n=1 Tax=Marivirga sericea TaxID=1028 RepID=A0A1X7JNN4_9BACT|nr:TolC family protein [Marivirga sericea]SMG29517.1 Outer membrane protein TolC [Marivirga sericea]
MRHLYILKYFSILLSTCFLQLLSFSAIGQDSTNRLDSFFKIAVENNPKLQAEYKAYEAALQKLPQASSLSEPNLSIGYFVSPVETRVGPQLARFSLTQMFPWFGTLKSQENVVALEAESKFQSFLNVRNKLYWEVASAYYPLYELRKLQQIEKENIEILNSYKSLAERKFSSSKGTMVDVLRVDIMMEDAKTNLEILEQKEKPLITAFQNVINKEVEVEIPETLNAIDFEPSLVKDSLFDFHPLIQMLEYKKQAAEANESLAQKQGLPKIGLGLDYVIVGERQDMDLADNGKDILMPMVSISLPIFRKKYTAQKKEAQLMQESFELQKQNLKNQLDTDYETTLFEIKKQLELMNLYERQVKKTESTLEILWKTYSASGTDFEEVLRIQQQFLKYRKLKATAEAEFNIKIEKYNYLINR